MMSSFELQLINYDSETVYTYTPVVNNIYKHSIIGTVFKEIWRIGIHSPDVLGICGIYAYGGTFYFIYNYIII